MSWIRARWMVPLAAGLLALAAVAAADGEDAVDDLARRLDAAVRGYDSAAAIEVQGHARSLARDNGSGAARELLARADLAVAELLRVEYEETPQGEAQARRLLGQRIDVAAEEGLAALEELPPTSEHWRMRADLYATMIRSDFRARKYENEFETAVGHALEADPDNARAWVTRSKRSLFADPEHGGDPAEALRLLDKALAIDPSLEDARLLRALAYDKLGETPRAVADWRDVLRRNPRSEPARRELERRGLGPGG